MFQQEDINKEIARRLKVDLKLVTAVNDKQWKLVEYNMKEAKHSSIKVLALGTFLARYSVVKKLIRYLVSLIRETYKQEEIDRKEERIKLYKKRLSDAWGIKNEFAVNNVRIKNKKLNKENEN